MINSSAITTRSDGLALAHKRAPGNRLSYK